MENSIIVEQYYFLRSCRAVAEKNGCSIETIRRILKKENVPLTGWKTKPEYARPKKKYYYKRPYTPVSYNAKCEYCGKEYVSHRKGQMYCSEKCKNIAIRTAKGIKCNPNVKPFIKICEICGKEYETFRDTSRTCSHECAEAWQICGRRNNRKPWSEYISQLQKQAEERATQRKQERERHKEQHTIERFCAVCGESFYCLDVDQKKYCSKSCARRNRHKDKRLKPEQKVDNISLNKLFKRDNGVCYLCGGKCDWNDWRLSASGYRYPGENYPTIEHVIPVSFGGLNSWENVRLAHWKCNMVKGASSTEEVEPATRPIQRKSEKKTAQYSKEGQLIRIWDSTAQIRRETGLSDKYIQNACRGERGRNTAYGYAWEYVT